MAFGARHVVLAALVTLLVTYAAFQGKASSGDTVSLQNRKGLADPQVSEATPVLGEDAVTETESDTESTKEATFENAEDDALTPPIVEDAEEATNPQEARSSEGNAEDSVETQEDSEEAPLEAQQVREMLDVMAPLAPAMSPQDSSSAQAPSTVIENPDASNYPKPKGDPRVFLQAIAADNKYGQRNEWAIQNCIREDGCGTPE